MEFKPKITGNKEIRKRVYITHRNVNNMKNASKIGYILLIGVVLGAFTSCTKEVSGEFNAYPNNPLNDTVWATTLKATDAVNIMINELMPATERFTINLEDSESEIKVGKADSCLITFGRGIFTSIENGVVTPVKPEGSAVVQVFWIKRTGDLIKSMRSTKSSNVLTELGVGLFVSVTKDGKELSIANGEKYRVRVIETGSAPKNTMRKFNAVESNPAPASNVTDPNFNWVPDSDASVINFYWPPNKPPYYDMSLTALRWASAQREVDINTSSKCRLTAYFGPNYTNKNTNVFAYYTKQKTVVKLDFDYASRTFRTDMLPVGAEIKIVSLTKIGNNYYLGEKETSSLSSGSIVKIIPEKITLEKLQAYLDEI